MGIDELTDVVDFGIAFGNAHGKVMEDGKFSWSEVTEYIPALTKLPAAVSGIEQVDDEIKDLDEQEMEFLKQHVQEKFDIPAEHVEEVIEDAFAMVLSIVRFAVKLKGILKK